MITFEEQPQEIKMRSGDFLLPAKAWKKEGRVFLAFPFNRKLLSEVKMLQGSHWHGYDEVNPRKIWSIQDSQRNQFQLEFLLNRSNPYATYDRPLTPVDIKERYNVAKQKMIPLFKHQPLMVAHILQRGNPGCIVAGEMGTSKTLAAIIALEMKSQQFELSQGYKPEIWYVAPRVGLRAVQREFLIWGASIRPTFMTYNEVVKRMANWESGKKAPAFIIFDESSLVKTPTAQRSQAAKALADGCRHDWEDLSMVVLMSGSPAPKSPADWYWQAEIACPGFLKEGDINKFKHVLGIIVETKGIDGVYPRFVTWRDDEKKCNVCSQTADNQCHNEELAEQGTFHNFVACVNEVQRLHKRLKGLVEVYFKKDCLDLPDKHYKVIEVKPSASVLRAASMIVKSSPTTIEGLTRLRELSDGFQYKKEKTGNKILCTRCKGSKEATEYEEIEGSCPNCKDGIVETVLNGGGFAVPPQCPNHIPERKSVTVSCPNCGGTGEQDEFTRNIIETTCPKDTVIVDLLDELEDIGRIVIYGGFTGTIDRIQKVCQRQGWAVIRLDQGKEQVFDSEGKRLFIDDYLSMFQDWKERFPRVAYVANPGSGGMAATLTASPMIIYFSNTFIGQDRIQSEDRIHRPGMDYALGATIVDIIHLPSDLKVLRNLQQKRDLQSMSLGDFAEDIKVGTAEDRELVS